jgi:hypothetical protein
MLTSVHLVQWENADYFIIVSGCSIAGMVLMNLCTADTLDIVSGFGNSLHSLSTCTFPDLLPVLISALSVGSLACSLFMTADMLDQHDLGLNLCSILQLSSQITSLMIPGSPLTLTESKFLLIIITIGLMFLVGLVVTYRLVHQLSS